MEIIVLGGIVFLIYYLIKKVRKKEKTLKEHGFDIKPQIVNVKYSCGHPKVDKPGHYDLAFKDDSIYFLSVFKGLEVASINCKSIKNILVEDQSTVERRVTLARMALVGVFAFGMKKKKKNELAYVTIEWNDGRFDHSTIFEYENYGSMQRANKDRNKFISFVNEKAPI